MHPSWSPDGTRIALSSSRTGNFDIFVAEVDSGRLTQLTDDLADDRRPVWSPDGTRIVFQSMRPRTMSDYGDDTANLFVMNSDGSSVEQLTHHDGGVTMASWSPDGRFLAYLRDVESVGEPYPAYLRGTPMLYSWTSGKSSELFLDLPRGDVQIHGTWLFDWSPDSSRIAFNSDSHRRSTGAYRADLFVAAVETGAVEVVSKSWHDHTWPFGANWSPDGRRLVFAMNVDTDNDASTWDNRIAVVDLKTGVVTKLPSPGNAWEPCWSPDGARIAFAARPEGAKANNVYVINADGSGLRNLTGASGASLR